MELKVQCDCGQKFKFDVEPANGRMPFAINCPACGTDGTEKANVLIQQSGYVGESLPVAQLVAAAPPPPIAAAAVPSRLRINSTAPAASAHTPPPIAPTPAAPRPFPGMARPTAPAPAEASGKKPPNFWLGLVGGFLGVFLGATIYFLVFKYSGHRIGLLGIGVGFLGGLGAHFLGRGEGSKELGGITAILAIAGI